MEKKKSNRFQMILLILLACSLLLVILHIRYGEIKKKTILTFGMFAGGQWDVPNDDCYKIIDETIEEFEAEHPEVEVRYVSGIQKDDYSEWISKAALNGELPDVFMVLQEDLEVFSRVGALYNLDMVIANDVNFAPSAYYKACYQAGQYKSHQYALPYESNPTLLFVNNSLLKERNIDLKSEQLTWNEFYQLCSMMTIDQNGDGAIDQFGVYDYGWRDAIYSNGGTIFDPEKRTCTLTGADAVDAISFAKKIFQVSGYHIPLAEDFDLGKVVFRPMKFSEFRTYKPYPYKLNKYANFEWDCTQLPVGPSENYQSYVDNLLMGISSNTKQLEYAWMFLKKLTYNTETQKKIFSYSQGVSVLKDVTNSEETQNLLNEELGEDTGVKVSLLNTVMEHAISREKIEDYDEIINQIDGDIVQMIVYNRSIDDGLREIKKKVDKLLQN